MIPADEPIVPDTRMHGVVAVPHPYLDEDFGTLPGPDGKPELQFLTLVPMTRAELDFADRNGIDALFEQWEDRETDLVDIHRASV